LNIIKQINSDLNIELRSREAVLEELKDALEELRIAAKIEAIDNGLYIREGGNISDKYRDMNKCHK
jgi:hypothetical protein